METFRYRTEERMYGQRGWARGLETNEKGEGERGRLKRERLRKRKK